MTSNETVFWFEKEKTRKEESEKRRLLNTVTYTAEREAARLRNTENEKGADLMLLHCIPGAKMKTLREISGDLTMLCRSGLHLPAWITAEYDPHEIMLTLKKCDAQVQHL